MTQAGLGALQSWWPIDPCDVGAGRGIVYDAMYDEEEERAPVLERVPHVDPASDRAHYHGI